jgi:hypothetical protein
MTKKSPQKKRENRQKSVENFSMPAYLQSQLRLFFTLDIVGSTAYKQKNMSIDGVSAPLPFDAESRKNSFHSAWFKAIGDFYEMTPTLVSRYWGELKASHMEQEGIDLDLAPAFWKAIGDEVGFTKRIENLQQITACLKVLLKVLDESRRRLQTESPELDIKACAWVAGFPVTNTEVVFPIVHKQTKEIYANNDDAYVFQTLEKLRDYYEAKDNPSSEMEKSRIQWVRDFTGPSIDTGFRIASHATPRKLIISLELAYLLSHDDEKINNDKSKNFSRKLAQPIIYQGRQSLKGVMGGIPYPIFWIDTESMGEYRALHEAEARLIEATSDDGKRADKRSVIDFCEAFFAQNKRYITKPYIPTNKLGGFGELPEEHKNRFKQLKAIVEAFEDHVKQRSLQNNDIAAPNLGDELLSENITLTVK